MNLIIRDIRVYSGVALPGVEMVLPCVYFHVDSESSISTTRFLDALTEIECVIQFDMTQHPASDLHLFFYTQDDVQDKRIQIMHLSVTLPWNVAHSFSASSIERDMWCLLIKCDEESRVLCLSVSIRGPIVQKKLITVNDLYFLCPGEMSFH